MPAFRTLLDQAFERIAAHIDSLPTQPAGYVGDGDDLADALREDWPKEPIPFDAALELFFGKALSKTYNTAGPGYLAYIPGGGLVHAALGDFIAQMVNRYSTVWLAAPGLVQLETNVLRWFCRVVGFPERALGLLCSGGSLATLSAVVSAREKMLGSDFSRGMIYTSDQGHHCIGKAARIAGFPVERVRVVPSDDAFRINCDRLAEMIEEDLRDGFRPFMIAANAGTTNTGAIDDLPRLAQMAKERKLWFHVDAAYGGFFALTRRGKQRLRGMNMADSIVLDPHKGLFLPYGTGCLLVRDPSDLERAHALSAEYMPPMQVEDGRYDFCQMGPELSRDYRGLRLWLPLKTLGFEAFANALDDKLDIAEYAAEELSRMDDFEVLGEPQLSVVAFRWNDRRLPKSSLNAANKEVQRRVNARQRVMLTGTMLGDRYVLRICVLHLRTDRARVAMALEDLHSVASTLANDFGA